jgi:light-regulated signal transduction histidine kinase (bacteriophytochrome)
MSGKALEAGFAAATAAAAAALTVWIAARHLPSAAAGLAIAVFWVLAAFTLGLVLQRRSIASLRQEVEQPGVPLAPAALEAQRRAQPPDALGLRTEVDQFAYAASHDLYEPARITASFLQLLKHTSEEQLHSDAREFLDSALDALGQFRRRLDGLLEYSRVATRGHEFTSFEARAAVDAALLALGSEIESAGALVTCGPLPVVVADPEQLRRLFEHLLGNALKFRRSERPRVHVSAQESEGEWVFAVEDQGVGIDPRYAGSIFAPFRRLHTSEEYPGEGMGLAIARRIAERHGGRIWVRSVPGAGSTFSFTLARPQAVRRSMEKVAVCA